MTKDNFLKLAEICGENFLLSARCSTQDGMKQSSSMANCIALDIFEMARKELCHFTTEEWESFREKFFELSRLD